MGVADKAKNLGIQAGQIKDKEKEKLRMPREPKLASENPEALER